MVYKKLYCSSNQADNTRLRLRSQSLLTCSFAIAKWSPGIKNIASAARFHSYVFRQSCATSSTSCAFPSKVSRPFTIGCSQSSNTTPSQTSLDYQSVGRAHPSSYSSAAISTPKPLLFCRSNSSSLRTASYVRQTSTMSSPNKCSEESVLLRSTPVATRSSGEILSTTHGPDT